MLKVASPLVLLLLLFSCLSWGNVEIKSVINAKKILIIGCSGSGKTTLALKLAEMLQLPVYHLDILQWRPGWITTPEQEYLMELTKITKQREWILEGNEVHLQDQILHAQVVIFLDMPWWYCLKNVCIRHWKYYKKDRPYMSKGCPAKFDWKMLSNLVWNFKNRRRPKILGLLNNTQNTPPSNIKIYHLSSLAEVLQFTTHIFNHIQIQQTCIV